MPLSGLDPMLEPCAVQLAVWKTDKNLRPIFMVAFEEQPGCRIKV